jgi:hypothetical protein
MRLTVESGVVERRGAGEDPVALSLSPSPTVPKGGIARPHRPWFGGRHSPRRNRISQRQISGQERLPAPLHLRREEAAGS